uniref:Uncharacterized protein n=1 Tax=Trichogramma kaykai TaxID=54128 RepID=A0ABD2XBP5_9HYME
MWARHILSCSTVAPRLIFQNCKIMSATVIPKITTKRRRRERRDHNFRKRNLIDDDRTPYVPRITPVVRRYGRRHSRCGVGLTKKRICKIRVTLGGWGVQASVCEYNGLVYYNIVVCTRAARDFCVYHVGQFGSILMQIVTYVHYACEYILN